MKLAYQKLLDKYHLPNVQHWLTVDDELTLGDLRASFQDKLYSFSDMLNTILRPEDIPAMAEAQVFSEEERERIEAFYDRLMLLAKDCTIADIAATEDEELALVKRLCTEWPSIVVEMKAVVAKTKHAYNGLKPGIHHVSYLG